MNIVGKSVSTIWAIGVLIAIVILAGVATYILSLRDSATISTFAECKAAGGAILETYPEQCRIYGKSYTNQLQPDIQQPKTDGSEYIGMTEEDALEKAKKEQIPARVVERDDEQLAITMDFAFGRLNLHIKDGKVYQVEVEGVANDAN